MIFVLFFCNVEPKIRYPWIHVYDGLNIEFDRYPYIYNREGTELHCLKVGILLLQLFFLWILAISSIVWSVSAYAHTWWTSVCLLYLNLSFWYAWLLNITFSWYFSFQCYSSEDSINSFTTQKLGYVMTCGSNTGTASHCY